MRGFTLIETIVYLALFTMIIGGFVSASYSLSENAGRNQTKAMLQDEEDFIVGKILSSLESANAISLPGSSSSGSALNFTTYAGGSVTVSLSGSNVIWNGGVMPLNNANVSLTQLTFTHTGSGTNPESVQVDITANAKTPNGMTITESLSATHYIRK
jgi:archaellum component FlaF (FlaF/FlaG flagellin family)